MNKLVALMISLLLLQGCLVESDKPLSASDKKKQEVGKFLGGDTFSFATGKNKKEGLRGTGVNVYLWRASLDTLSFMPIEKIDPFSGVIISGWYDHPGMNHLRMKVNVSILNEELRSDGVRVSVFQQKKKNGEWVNTESSSEVARKLEESILTRARQMKKKKMKIG